MSDENGETAPDGALPLTEILSLPGVFIQSQPLTTEGYIAEAKRRGLDANAAVLREFYRRGDLVPLLEVVSRKVCDPVDVAMPSRSGGTRVSQLREALLTGRVRDLGAEPFRARLDFSPARGNLVRNWWNGIVYSPWQLLTVKNLRTRASSVKYVGGTEAHRARLPVLASPWQEMAMQRRRWAVALTVLEGRYAPVLERGWVLLSNMEHDEWDSLCRDLPAKRLSVALGVDASAATKFAERLLLDAHSIDPLGDWAALLRRAPSDKRKSLSGDALLAMDERSAAEILLRFAEDLCGAPIAAPAAGSRVWHPLRDRLSAGDAEPLDELLTGLGVSPHPRVILAVEGETEAFFVPRILEALGLRSNPELIHVVNLRGKDKTKGLQVLAAAFVAPLLGEKHGSTVEMLRPPTHLFVIVDTDGRWSSDEKAETERKRIAHQVTLVIEAQGHTPLIADVDRLVQVRRWPSKSFEFAHFSDEQLADALLQVAPGLCHGDRDDVLVSLADSRARGLDVSRVWSAPRTAVSKPALANALWPVMADQIAQIRRQPGDDVPHIVAFVDEAYHTAVAHSRHRYALSLADVDVDGGAGFED